MSRTWRLIVDGPVPGAWNMALDRAVQYGCDEGASPPTLRLYHWDRPTVTLGRFQTLEGVDLAACDELGIDVVRRFTGGRGVLHDDEVTYSIVASVADGVPRGVAASYRYLCAGLAEAYAALGVPAELTARPRGDAASPACYLHATAADLSLGALKLSGSAQVWHGDTVMQHGSFTISRNLRREARVFTLDEREAARLGERTATIERALGAKPSGASVRTAIVEGIGRALGVEFVSGTLTPHERRAAERLLPETDPRAPIQGRVRPSR